MLERLQSILNRGGAITLDQLAGELDTTPEMIAQLIDYLQRLGQLKPIGADCDTACTGCYLARTCDRSAVLRVWSSVN